MVTLSYLKLFGGKPQQRKTKIESRVMSQYKREILSLQAFTL